MASRRKRPSTEATDYVQTLSREERIALLWESGDLFWKLYQRDQLPVYEFVRDHKARTVVINISRQFGKSFIACLLAEEFARKHQGCLIRFVTGDQKALRKIVQPIFRQIHADCPDHLRPVFNSLDSCFRYHNGSELHLAGANNGHADDSRGQRAHLCVVDEAGFVDDLGYLVTSVLKPQTLTTGGKVILISTPPVTPAHDFVRYCTEAELDGAYIVRTLDDNHHITEGEKQALIKDLGGKTSTQAQRELFCKFVVDESYAVIPEFGAREADIVKPVAKPTHEQPTVAIDVGFEDLTAVLYGYWDFRRAVLCIQAESTLRRARTDDIAAAIVAQEDACWNAAQRAKVVRWSDTDLRLIADLADEHRLYVHPTAKDDKEAQVNGLRLLVQAGKLEIDPSCRVLIATLKTAVWNKQRTEFARLGGTLGHADALDALLYLARNVDRHTNPYPLYEGLDPMTHHIPVHSTESETAQALASLFRIKTGRG